MPLNSRKDFWFEILCVKKERVPGFWRLSSVVTTLMLLSACGGGGNSGSSVNTGSDGSTGGTLPSLIGVSPTSITVTAALDQNAPSALVLANIEDIGAGPITVTGTTTHNGVDAVGYTTGAGGVDIGISFKTPSEIGVGTHKDTLDVQGCDALTCQTPIAVSITYIVTPPIPEIESLTPLTVTSGTPAFTLTVGGSYFASTSQVYWNGTQLPTTYVSSSELTAQVSAADIASAGTANIQVGATGALSDPAMFYISNPVVLTLNQVSPSNVVAGGASFYLTAVGVGFYNESVINWNGTPLATTYVSATQLRALVPANLIAKAGNAAITVANQTTQGSQIVTIASPSLDATAYQMNAAHTGAVSFQNLQLPSASSWSVDVGGTPSYAVIVGGRIFVAAALSGGGSNLFALDAHTGAILWGPIALAGQVDPAYDGGRLFAVYGTTSTFLAALDPTSGNPLWTVAIPDVGLTIPAVAFNGIVYTAVGGTARAFDESSGTQLWTAIIGYGSGTEAVTVDGVYGSTSCYASDLQPAFGTTTWKSGIACTGGVDATPVVANGVMYSNVGMTLTGGVEYNSESGASQGSYIASAIPAVSPTTAFLLSNGTLQGVALSNNQVLWSFSGDGQLVSAPVSVNNYVFVGSASGALYALDATTGAQTWMQNLGAPIPPSFETHGTTYTGLAAGDGILVVPNGTKITAFTLSSSP